MICLSPIPFPQCAHPGAPGEGLGPVQHHPDQERPEAASGGPCQPPLPGHQGLCDHPCGHSQVTSRHKGLRGEEIAPIPFLSTSLSLPRGSQEVRVPVLLFLPYLVNLGKSLALLSLSFPICKMSCSTQQSLNFWTMTDDVGSVFHLQQSPS